MVKTLKDVLPPAFLNGGSTRAYAFRDEKVTQFRYGSEWIGPEQDIQTWFVLHNGYAVGINKHDNVEPFPTYKMPPRPPRLVSKPRGLDVQLTWTRLAQ
jgi:hypothetical protein